VGAQFLLVIPRPVATVQRPQVEQRCLIQIDLISVVLIDQGYPHSRGNDDFT
jgi:hypothetical protein